MDRHLARPALQPAVRRRPPGERADRHALHGQLPARRRDPGARRPTASCGSGATPHREPAPPGATATLRRRHPRLRVGRGPRQRLPAGRPDRSLVHDRPVGAEVLLDYGLDLRPRHRDPPPDALPRPKARRRAGVRRRHGAVVVGPRRRPRPRQAPPRTRACSRRRSTCSPTWASQPATLQAGLIAAQRVDRHRRPVGYVTSPAPARARATADTPVTITGTATDAGGGRVGGVEVSTDGGATWHPAAGRRAGRYTWTPGAPRPRRRSARRAVDDSGNLGPPPAIRAPGRRSPGGRAPSRPGAIVRLTQRTAASACRAEASSPCASRCPRSAGRCRVTLRLTRRDRNGGVVAHADGRGRQEPRVRLRLTRSARRQLARRRLAGGEADGHHARPCGRPHDAAEPRSTCWHRAGAEEGARMSAQARHRPRAAHRRGQPGSPPRRRGRSRRPDRARAARSSSSWIPRTRSAATTREILRAEGLNEFTVADIANVTPATLAGVRRRRPRHDAARRRPRSTMLTDWVNGGGNLIAMRPGQAARGAARADRRRRDAHQRLPAGRHRRRRPAPASSARRCSSTAPPTATRSTARRARRDAVLDATTRHRQPGGDAARRRQRRRPGRGVHLRPRALGRLHAPGQPGLGRPGARRQARRSAPTTCSSARGGRRSPTGSTSTRSRSRRPTSSSACW